MNNVKHIELINHVKTHENIFIEYGGLMVSFENMLIGKEAKGSKLFYYLDYKEPDQLHRFGEIGLGPTDFATPFSMQYINRETYGIYDVTKKSFTELALPESNKEIIIKKVTQVENKIGYISGDATDEYVYLLRGNQSIEYFASEQKEYETDDLVIYNWEGTLIKEIKLDIPCRNICVTPDNKRIWAIANTPEPSLVFFNLPEFFS
jgi:hypothetical protein